MDNEKLRLRFKKLGDRFKGDEANPFFKSSLIFKRSRTEDIGKVIRNLNSEPNG